jgi:type I restriction enzyme S subunit
MENKSFGHNRTEQNRTEQNRTEQNRTEQNKTEQNRTEGAPAVRETEEKLKGL